MNHKKELLRGLWVGPWGFGMKSRSGDGQLKATATGSPTEGHPRNLENLFRVCKV